MAAIESSRALLALTSAALALPGMRAQAAAPLAAPEGHAQFGFYQENDRRMRVEITHGDMVLPVSDRVELSFAFDRDTYSGATPAFSIPQTMANQPKFSQNADGSPASTLSFTDVVSQASQGVTAGGLTILGGLNAFAGFIDARAAAEAAFIAANPRPLSPPAPPTLPGPVTLDFSGMPFASYQGAANDTPVAGGACPGLAAFGCYLEDGMAVGIVADATNPVAHLHRVGPAANRALGYHADSSGIYIRALDGSTFNLDSMLFRAPLSGANPDAGADDVWEILGFDTAIDPTLGAGDGVTYPSRVALQTVANGFDGTLTLDPAFQNIRAFWIHYRGYPRTPADGKDFEMRLDDVQLSGVAPGTAETPEQVAWAAQLEREVAIAQFQAVLDRAVPAGEPPTQRMQQQPRETRNQPTLSAKFFLDDTSLAVNGGISDEPDFRSSFGSFTLSREFNDALTTVALGYGYTHNDITRAGAHDHAEFDHEHGDVAEYPALDEESHFHQLNLSLGQVLDKHRLLQVSVGYTRQRGYLSNPYKLVYVRGEITAEEYYDLWQRGDDDVDWTAVTPLEVVGIELFRERRPDLRRLWTVSTRFNQHLPALDASVHVDYRYYTDDWEVDSHTLGVEWYQTLPNEITVTPFLRYYTQSRAAFFAPYFLAPRADGFYSSDFRLSGYGALSGGITFAKSFGDAVRVQAGLEYYTHEGALKLGGGGAGDYADFSAYMVHAALNVDLSAATRSGTHHHHMHHADHAMAPAGVMYAHGLSAGAFMVGYRYMDMRQGGALQADGDAVSDAFVAANGCGTGGCRSRPTDMTMRMHMLEVMYAPTPQLTLMLMPQILDSSMSQAQLAGAPAADHHLGEHTSDGLGDTIVAALWRMFTRDGHQVQAGIALSAPTGDSDATPTDFPDDLPLDFGMQRGSGTWDARPTLTYSGHHGAWQWGAQIGGVIRLESRNDAGYALGDGWHATGWGGYRLARWLTGTVRGLYNDVGQVEGDFRIPHAEESPVDFPRNTGMRTWDLGLGVTVAPPGDAFAGHALAIEWLQPLATDFEGVQLERDGALMASWSFTF